MQLPCRRNDIDCTDDNQDAKLTRVLIGVLAVPHQLDEQPNSGNRNKPNAPIMSRPSKKPWQWVLERWRHTRPLPNSETLKSLQFGELLRRSPAILRSPPSEQFIAVIHVPVGDPAGQLTPAPLRRTSCRVPCGTQGQCSRRSARQDRARQAKRRQKSTLR